MKTIFKYPIKLADIQDVRMPRGAKIISAQMQGEQLCLWAEVDNTVGLKWRSIEVFGTGHPMPEAPRLFIGTVQMHGGSLIWHVYERIPVTALAEFEKHSSNASAQAAPSQTVGE